MTPVLVLKTIFGLLAIAGAATMSLGMVFCVWSIFVDDGPADPMDFGPG